MAIVADQNQTLFKARSDVLTKLYGLTIVSNSDKF